MRKVRIENTDPEIKYAGAGWVLDDQRQFEPGNPDGGIFHRTSELGSVSYTFHGTSITVLGTADISGKGNGIFDPSWDCFVDGVSIGSNAASVLATDAFTLCESLDLSDGLHIIDLHVATSSRRLWFAGFYYNPSPSLSQIIPVAVVDNSDPGIRLNQWWLHNDALGPYTAFNNATVDFTFNCTGISWIGWIPLAIDYNPSSIQWSIDMDHRGQLQVPYSGLWHDPRGNIMPVTTQVLFTSPTLPQGQHHFSITYLGSGNQTPLTLDSLRVFNDASMASPLSGVSSPPTKSSSVATIIGGVVGGFASTVLILILVWKWKKNRL